MDSPFLSSPPIVRLTKAFTTPFRNVVATARTCYSSKGIVRDEEVGGPEKFTSLARSIYEAGHHTTFQHAHFQFALENVSRQFIWSFLHAHPFYNSEQVSQRYVAVKPDTLAVPKLDPRPTALYRETAERMFGAYRELCTRLEPVVEAEFFKRFHRSERLASKHAQSIQKKSQEVARYVLPVGTTAYLYHTVSALTLFRYWRAAMQRDCPAETHFVVGRMVEEVLAHDPEYRITLQEPLDESAFPEEAIIAASPELLEGARAAAFRDEFDASLRGATARLTSYHPEAQTRVADGVREMLGLTRNAMSDDDAIALAMSPARNKLLGESLNLTSVAKLTRALVHASYTFRKKLSHTADSQDQRHRLTPGSRPILAAHLDDTPDVVVPELIRADADCERLFNEAVECAWSAMAKLRRMGVSPEWRAYLLPNAVSVRFSESGDLMALRHKHQMRLCYNAQEEIWRASRDEALQVREVHPLLGRYLLPPCTLRSMAKARPICPEGPRYCGVLVWKMEVEDYRRTI